MSYKSLLFCPDEKTARVVTQVLSELEFTVELSGEPFATVKKLTDEHFDALVVDCQNEQDASLLFKAARNSSLNHSSLSVAVVEGQAGVAKAFRIGANLVLSKPVNVEQSKSTLRVARGLLRKNSEARAAAEGSAPAAKPAAAPSVSSPAMSPSRPFAFDSANLSASSPAAIPAPAAPSAPYSALELDQDPTPAPEPSEAALLESMPNPIDGKPPSVAEHLWAPRSQGQAEPIAASTGGHGAAAAPALARIVEPKLGGASPMVTHEPIVAETGATEHFPVATVPVPTFSMDLDAGGSNSGNQKFIKTVAVVLLLGVAGYLGWQRLQPLKYLPGSTPAQTVKPPVTAAEVSPAPAHAAQLPANAENGSGETASSATTSSTMAPEPTTITASSTSAPSASARTGSENVRVQEMPMNSEQRNSLAAKPQPIVIQPTMTQPIVVQPNTIQKNTGNSGTPKQAQPTPPPLSAASSSDAALANIVSTDPAKPTLGSFRVSQGVSQGLVIKKVAPVYSPTALQLRKEGSVDLVATIGKDGSVTSVQVVKGDLVLAKSAVEAVKQWKYRPYLLNGEPVEIQTQITVNFKLPR
jgi:TonB family protein